ARVPIPSSAPQVLELPKRQVTSKSLERVRYVDYQAALCPTFKRASEPTANHLLGTRRAKHRPGHVDSLHLRGVEAGGKHAVIGEHPNLAGFELLDVVSAGSGCGLTGNPSGGDTLLR